MVYRIYVEKKPGFDGEAQSLRNELVSLLGIKELNGLRLLNRYDVEGIDEALFEQCVPTVFSEPPVDNTYAELPAAEGVSFAVEYLPGQFDQRADSASECIQLLSQGERPSVRSARIYLLDGELSAEDLEAIKKYVINPVEAREASLDERSTLKMEFAIPTEVETLTGNVRVLGAIAYLRRLYQALDEAGYGDRIMIDLGLVHEMDYYTGIMFRGYIGGAGAAILAGGRYNALCAKFGRDLPAGGFGIDVESVAESLQGASRPEVATRRDTVRIALTKGRLEKKTLALLKDAGYDISELEAGTRKLIFTLPDSGVEIVLSKAADVITYVEHGVCDMGVVGKDTIMEKGGSFYEMVDLGFGKCRFALATKKGKDVYGGYKTPVIATKYPAVTKAFFNRKNMDVETIKIEGSVELAPLLELADAIVDIVETGTTLKENGLEVIEDVAPISARVIVNLASAKMKKTAIQKVIAELEKGLEK